jgi:HD-GYP domain-containing protein (c-di-GMP phosphodiesterase class II)
MKTTTRRRTMSMKFMISLASVGLVCLAVAGIFGMTERNVQRALQREMETRLLLEARHLALLSADALLTDYPELTLCPIVSEMLQRRPDLARAVVLDHLGRIQGHPDVRRLGSQLTLLGTFTPHAALASMEDDEIILVNHDIMAARVPARHAGGQVVGSVLVAQDRHHITTALARNRQQVALLTVGLAAVAALVTLLVMGRLLAPLDALRAGLERIGRGDLDTPIRLRSRTELGLLAEAIDTMAADLKESQAETRAKEQEVIATQSEVIHTPGEVVESRSHETGNHVDRVAEGAALLARLAGLPAEECELLRLAAPMHDVGKIGIPDAVLNKPGKLTDAEYDLMKTHTTLGHQILSQSDRPIMKAAAIVANEHHERWDGRGYPNGIAGEEVHVFGRIVAIVDVFDALTSDRCYRPAMPLAEALCIMVEGRGSQFDPELLDLFLENLDQFRDFMESRFDELQLVKDAGAPVPAPVPDPESPALIEV